MAYTVTGCSLAGRMLLVDGVTRNSKSGRGAQPQPIGIIVSALALHISQVNEIRSVGRQSSHEHRIGLVRHHPERAVDKIVIERQLLARLISQFQDGIQRGTETPGKDLRHNFLPRAAAEPEDRPLARVPDLAVDDDRQRPS